MSSGTQTPTFQTANITQDYSVGGQLDKNGNTLMSDIMAQRNQGLPPALKALMEQQGLGAISGNVAAGKQSLAENSYGATTGAKLGAMSDLYKGAGEQRGNLSLGINQADYNAQQGNMLRALQGYQGLTGLSSNIGNLKNQYSLANTNMMNQNAMNKYEIDKSNEFGWGQLLGGLFGAGGSLLGGMASGGTGFFRKKKTS